MKLSALKFWWLLGLVALLFGCRNVKISDKQSKDSSSVKERVVTKTITLPGEKIPFQIPCPDATKPNQPKQFSFKGQNGGTVTGTIGSDNVVRGFVDCPQLRAEIVEKDNQITKLKSTQSKKQTENTSTPWYDKVCRIVTLIFLLWILFVLLRSGLIKQVYKFISKLY